MPRKHEDGTWITREMQRAYIRLHELGHAQSMESWREGSLVGGIYGVRTGSCFCGESMFHLQSDASKVALAALVRRLDSEGTVLIDCQVPSSHMLSLGARPIARSNYLRILRAGLAR